MTWGIALFLGVLISMIGSVLAWNLPSIESEQKKIGRDLARIANALEKIARDI